MTPGALRRGEVILRACAAIALLGPLAACATTTPPAPAHAPTLAEWRAARARLAELRRASERPRTLRVAIRLREPITGKLLDARGAVAIDPRHAAAASPAPPGALRMILLGPGGTTALDLWLAEGRFRFAIPALDLLRRGDADAPPRGLPVAFLRYWLLRPAEGTLLWARRDAAADRFILRDGPAIVDLVVRDDGHIEARRATWSEGNAGEPPRLLDDERITADALGCARARYHQASTGLDVDITCEGEDTNAPPPRAFLDPDAPPANPPEGSAP